MSCVLCGSDRFRPLHTLEGYTIARCASCALTQLHPLPDAKIIASLYDDAYYHEGEDAGGYVDYASQEAEYSATFREEIRRIEHFHTGQGPIRILDVGCGPGYFVAEALAAGHDAYGIDIIPEVIAEARTRFPDRVFLGAPGDFSPLDGMTFDVVFASHVIEHVPDPIAFTRAFLPYLNEGGMVFYVTPNVESWLARASGRRWVSFKVPEHLTYFAPGTISTLFERSGFETIGVESAYQSYRVSFIAQRLRELLDPLARIVPRVERAQYLGDRIVRITSGSLRAVARPRAGATGDA